MKQGLAAGGDLKAYCDKHGEVSWLRCLRVFITFTTTLTLLMMMMMTERYDLSQCFTVLR